MSWWPLDVADVGHFCCRCRRVIRDRGDELAAGGAVRVPLLAGGFVVYRWCGACMRRRRERAERFKNP